MSKTWVKEVGPIFCYYYQSYEISMCCVPSTQYVFNTYVTVLWGRAILGKMLKSRSDGRKKETWSETVVIHDEVVLGGGLFQSSRYNDPVSKRQHSKPSPHSTPWPMHVVFSST